MLGGALTALIIWLLAWFWFGGLLLHSWPWSGPHNETTQLDVTRIALTVVAGVGGIVALTVAYRRQRNLESNLYTERFGAAAEQLGDSAPAVRLAGVYAMAALADVAVDQRQQCIDVLCAYLRLPYLAKDGQGQLTEIISTHRWPVGGGDATEQRTYQLRPSDREVRHTIIRVIRDHLRPEANAHNSWRGYDLDFTGVTFDGGDFSGAIFSAGTVSFSGATFSGGAVNFTHALFDGADIYFDGALFRAGTVNFSWAKISGGRISFKSATFAGSTVTFDAAACLGGSLSFVEAVFTGGRVSFHGVGFAGSEIWFHRMQVSGGTLAFPGTRFDRGKIPFSETTVDGGTIEFDRTHFQGSTVVFERIMLRSGLISFPRGVFAWGHLEFTRAQLVGGKLDFSLGWFKGAILTFDRTTFAGSTVPFTHASSEGGLIDMAGSEWAVPPIDLPKDGATEVLLPKP